MKKIARSPRWMEKEFAYQLVPRAVVATAGACCERRLAVRWFKADLDAAPAAVVMNIARLVPEDVLGPQLHANLPRKINQFAQACDRKKMAAGHLGELGKQAGTVAFLRGSPHVVRIENSKRIKLAVGFLQKASDFAFVVPAVIIPAVRDDEQNMPVISRIFHLRHTQVDRVQKGGPPLWLQ